MLGYNISSLSRGYGNCFKMGIVSHKLVMVVNFFIDELVLFLIVIVFKMGFWILF